MPDKGNPAYRHETHRLVSDGVEGRPPRALLLLLPLLRRALLAFEVREKLLQRCQTRGSAEPVAGVNDGQLRTVHGGRRRRAHRPLRASRAFLSGRCICACCSGAPEVMSR